MKEQIIKYLSDYTGIPEEQITDKTNLFADLGLNSLDFATILFEAESRFNISINENEYSEILTVGDLIKYINREYIK